MKLLPYSQSGLLIAGLWSIFLFREMALQTVFVYFLAGEVPDKMSIRLWCSHSWV